MMPAEDVFEKLRSVMMDHLEENPDLSDEEIREVIDTLILDEAAEYALSLADKEQLHKSLFYSVRKLDVLQELMDDPEITEIMVNGYRHIFYEKGGRLFQWNRHFTSQERLEDVIQQIVGRCNRVVNEQRPIVDARLPDDNGSRVNVVMNPVALEGPILTIRRFPEEAVTLEHLIRWESITREAAAFLRDLVEAQYSMLIGGGTSTGKTTFLNALSSCIPSEERIITIEDNAELQIQGIPNLVRMEARDANMEGAHALTIRDLIKAALRMRPNRIIIGEVRGAEAEDFLMCLNTGHAGSLGTAHANSVRDMISRIEMMVLMGEPLPVPVIRRQIVSGVEIMIHLTRDAQGRRRLGEIAELSGIHQDEPKIRTLFARDEEGVLKKVNELENREKLENLYKRRQAF
ncbi:MAG: Flp pilus assembly complex ATPase component TadA [Eubacterium sp.]|nr:Flp pilus assembly complex ATPase component TadA [Eubacterium sp.]